MIKLSKKDIIRMGIYSGETVESVLKIGRNTIFEILKYYDLSDDILDEYHIHPHNRKESTSIEQPECEDDYYEEEEYEEEEFQDEYCQYQYDIETDNYNRLFYGDDLCECEWDN